MIMKPTLIIAVTLCVFGTSNFVQAEEVQASDIGGKVIIMGRLGKPLGTVVTLDGQMVSAPKTGKSGQVTAALRVSEVNGQPLKRAPIIGLIFRPSAGVPSFHVQETVHLSGYETGAFIGTPDGARDSLGSEASPFDWKFETTIRVIKLEAAKVRTSLSGSLN